MTKRMFWMLAALGAIAALSLPAANWVADAPDEALTRELATIEDPHFRRAAPVLAANCAHCHATGTARPFYANFPVASDLIGADVTAGLARLDFAGRLKGSGEDFSEIELARLERVLNDGSMPPLRYTALHWRAHLSEQEKQDLLSWVYHRRDQMRQGQGVHPDFSGEPVAPIPQKVDLDPEKVALGNRLFHDTRLSGDNSISCASCHALDKGGTDQSRVSTGILGQQGGINAPTVYNAAYNFVQFWDGRAGNLREQAPGPVQNPIEMGATWPQVIAKLKQDPDYVRAFRKHYPKEGMTGDTIADAIVIFEESLITPDARFDRYLRGERDALGTEEVAGYRLFKTHCASCHAGTNLGGLSFEKMGWRRPYFVDKEKVHTDDFGRFNVTQMEADRHYFKVPTLRNVEVTYPYFHNGSVDDLREAVEVMVRHQTDAKLNDREIDQITAFLRTLTGQYQGQPLK